MDIDTKSLMLSQLIIEMTNKYEGFNIEYKHKSKSMYVIHWILFILTLGQFRSFMTRYITTIGHTVYVPEAWDAMAPAAKYVILSHEKVHMDQSKRYGSFLYAFLYLFMYLPFGYAYWRTKLEMEAYEVTIRASAEIYGKPHVNSDIYKNRMIRYFTGPDYLFMCVNENKIRKWLDGVLESL